MRVSYIGETSKRTLAILRKLAKDYTDNVRLYDREDRPFMLASARFPFRATSRDRARLCARIFCYGLCRN